MAIPNIIAVLLLSNVIAKKQKYKGVHLTDIDTTEIPYQKRQARRSDNEQIRKFVTCTQTKGRSTMSREYPQKKKL